MAYQNRLQCFVCNIAVNINAMARIDREANVRQRAIAINRRLVLNREDIPVTDRTRLCLPCNRSILEELGMQENPHAMNMNVLFPMHARTCIFCGANENLLHLSLDARVNVYIVNNIFIPENAQSCREHVNADGLILRPLIAGLRYTERPIIVPGRDLQRFFRKLREIILDPWNHSSQRFSEEEFLTLTSLTEDQFNTLHEFCVPVPRNDAGFRYVSRKDLLCFLCKIRQGVSDEFLRVIFRYSTRQSVSLAIKTALHSLSINFVPNNIGFGCIPRENYIAEHVTDFANQLYNPRPDMGRRAIVIIDGTYAYIEKSSNFRELRQTYCVHKHEHLVKPIMMVAPDGYILSIQGPYFSDFQNNDARILIDQFNRNLGDMENWIQPGDIFLVDRGYRDAIPFLNEREVVCKMPISLGNGQRQFTTEEANGNRLITKSRWVVESRNGHLRSKFKFFDKKIEKAHIPELNKYLLIAGAIINRYHPLIRMEDATVENAQRMLRKLREPNEVQARVEAENLRRRRRAEWVRLGHEAFPNFPRLTMAQLKDITFGTFQIGLARSYIQDKIIRDEEEEFQFDHLLGEPGFLAICIYSRFRQRIIHRLWIAYDNENRGLANVNADDLIFGYYCTCQCGARTIGCCAHIASMLWFLGYARHVENIKYPTRTILENVLDAGMRHEYLLDL